MVIDHPEETLQGQRFPHSLCSCVFFSGKPVGLTIVTISFSSQGKYIWPQCASFQKTSYILPIYPSKAKYPYFALEKCQGHVLSVKSLLNKYSSYTGLLCGFFLKNDRPSHRERKVVAGCHYGHFLTQATFTTRLHTDILLREQAPGCPHGPGVVCEPHPEPLIGKEYTLPPDWEHWCS